MKIDFRSQFYFILREEKSEAFMEAKEELDHKTSQYEKLRTEVK
jgi:hypothetical protein